MEAKIISTSDIEVTVQVTVPFKKVHARIRQPTESDFECATRRLKANG